MKIGDFFNKLLKSSETQLGTLNYEKNKYWEQTSSINKELIFIEKAKYRFEKISNVIGMIYFATLVLCMGLNFFGAIPTNFSIIYFLSTLGIGSLGYKIINEKINAEAIEERKSLTNERSLYQYNYDKCQDKINKLKKIIEQTNRAKRFFEVHQGEIFLDKKLPVAESQILQYLERDMSLLSILYLASNGELPSKLPSSMNYDELRYMMNLSSDVDKKLSDNPMLFFNDELYQHSKESHEKKDINKNSNDESVILTNEKRVIEYDSKEKNPRVRHYRSAKYREANNVNNQEENIGRKR